MAAPTITVARNDGAVVQGLQNSTGTQVTVSFEPVIMGPGNPGAGSAVPNRIAQNESCPPTYTLGRNNADIVAGGGANLWNTDVSITLPGERPAPGQE